MGGLYFLVAVFLSKCILVIINDVHFSFVITMMIVDLFLMLRC